MATNARAPLAGALALVLAAALVLPAYTAWVLVGAIALVIVLFAAGWPVLLELPSRVGSTLIVGASGLIALGLAVWDRVTADLITLLITVVAAAIFASFAHEMVRKSRHNLTLSLTGTASGALVSVIAVTWFQAWKLANLGGEGPRAFLLALAIAAACSLLLLSIPTTGKVRIPASLAGGTLSAPLVLLLLGFSWEVGVLGAVLGLAIAATAVCMYFLMERVIGAYEPRPFLAMSTAPVAMAGILIMLGMRMALSYFPAQMGLEVIPTALAVAPGVIG